MKVFWAHQSSYAYDQLNRIKAMTGYMAATQAPSGYSNAYSYDPNGNIKSQSRYSGSILMDDFTYHYNPSNNQLDYVSDAQTNDALFGVDIDNTQSAGNYGYDQIGQLDKDLDEDILEIKWTVTNKVKEVIYDGTLAGKKIVFDYNSMGNRIAKHVTLAGVTNSTYYVLDAQGNPMSIYSRQSDENILYLAERNIYGSSRIGMEEHHLLMTSETLSNTENLVEMDFNAGESSLGWPMQHNCTGSSSVQVNVGGKLKVTDPCATQHDLFINTVPGHRYEFSADFDVNNSTNFFINYSLHSDGVGTYGPVVTTQSLNVTTANRFTYEFIAATHWSRISLRNIGISNVVGTFTVDNIQLKHWLPEIAPENELVDNISGDKRYELANHLGNVLNVVTDRKLPEESSTNVGTVAYYLSDVVSYSDYDPFGMMLEGRHGSAGYRYGFNGMEKDDELKSSEGSSYDFGARMYDPRIGRWLSRDKLSAKYPMLSPYNYVSNNPIIFIDIDGNDFVIVVDKEKGIIEIQATYYTSNHDKTKKIVESALGVINSKNFLLKDADGTSYTVKFNLMLGDLGDLDDDIEIKQKALDDNSANFIFRTQGGVIKYNQISYNPDGTLAAKDALTGQTLEGGDWMQISDGDVSKDELKQMPHVADPQFTTANAIHEILHSLGVDHKQMTGFIDSKITSLTISTILTYASQRNKNIKFKDMEKQTIPHPLGRGTISFTFPRESIFNELQKLNAAEEYYPAVDDSENCPVKITSVQITEK